MAGQRVEFRQRDGEVYLSTDVPADVSAAAEETIAADRALGRVDEDDGSTGGCSLSPFLNRRSAKWSAYKVCIPQTEPLPPSRRWPIFHPKPRRPLLPLTLWQSLVQSVLSSCRVFSPHFPP
jgi:hypothetical protein